MMDSAMATDGLSSDAAGIASNNRLGKCESCFVNAAKYKCPKCSVASCSLECVQKHKVERSCSGKRDRTEYVSKKEYTEQHWNSDLGFIQDAHTVVALVKKSKNALTVGTPEAKSAGEESSALVSAFDTSKKTDAVLHLHPSKRQVKQRKILLDVLKQRNILFDSLPEIFSKRKQNNTHLQTENGERKVYWMVQVGLMVHAQNVLPVSLESTLSTDKKIAVSDICLSNGQTCKSYMKVLSHVSESWTLEELWSRFVRSLGRDQERGTNRYRAGTAKSVVSHDINRVLGGQQVENLLGEVEDRQECEGSTPLTLRTNSKLLESPSSVWSTFESIGMECYLKAEKCRCVGGSGDSFLLISVGSILQHVLCNQVVVEYPTLVFVGRANVEELEVELPKPCIWCLSVSRGIGEEGKIPSEIAECQQKKSEILCTSHLGQYEKMS